MELKISLIVLAAALALVGALRFLGVWTFKDSGVKAIARYSSTDAGDEAVLQQLQMHGSDMNKPTQIINYLYIPKLADAENIADHFNPDGYQVEVRGPLGRLPDGTVEPRYSVLLHVTVVPSIENIRKMRELMNRLASRFHGEYDGWEASVQH